MSKNGTLDDSQLQYFEQQKKKFFLFCSNIIYFHILATKYSNFFYIIPSLLPEKIM